MTGAFAGANASGRFGSIGYLLNSGAVDASEESEGKPDPDEWNRSVQMWRCLDVERVCLWRTAEWIGLCWRYHVRPHANTP